MNIFICLKQLIFPNGITPQTNLTKWLMVIVFNGNWFLNGLQKVHGIRIKTKNKTQFELTVRTAGRWLLFYSLIANLQSTVTICQTNALNVNVILAYVNYFSEYPHLASTYNTFLAQKSRDRCCCLLGIVSRSILL